MWVVPSTAFSDNEYSFAKFECNKISGTFQISELRGLDDESDAIASQPGTIDLTSLLVRKGEGDQEVLVPLEKHSEICKLGRQTYIAEVLPSKGISAYGTCGAAPPSVRLSLTAREQSVPFVEHLEFNRSCYDGYKGNIAFVKVLSKKRQIVFSVGSEGKTFEKTYSMDTAKLLKREDIIRVSLSLVEEHRLSLERFKQKGSANDAIDLLEAAGIGNALGKRPADIDLSIYVNILNDYAFFLSKTPNRHQEAIPILKRVIQLSPKRHIAYLNLGDTYARSLENATYPQNKRELRDLIVQNYREYARLIAARKQRDELPKRVQNVLVAD